MVMLLPRKAGAPRPYRALGEAIAEARRRTGMTQWELADAAHISRSYPGVIERGLNRPDPDVLRRIARVLEASYAELATLAGYVDASASEVVPAPPGYAGIVQRLIARYTPDQLTRFEQAMANLFFEITPLPNQPPDDAGRHESREKPDQGNTDRDSRGA